MPTRKPKPDPIVFVECPECGEEQADLGGGVRCENCGFGPMPSPSSAALAGVRALEGEHFVCPECGPRVKADEDGCCATCGRDCRVEGR